VINWYYHPGRGIIMDLKKELLEIRSLLVSAQTDLEENDDLIIAVKEWKIPSAIDKIDVLLESLD
jgi:hypothetical protein